MLGLSNVKKAKCSKQKKFLIIFMFVLLAVFFIGKIVTSIFPCKYLEYIKSCDSDIDPLFVLSVIKVESNFNKKACSIKGAMGLMQLMEPTALWVLDKIHEDNFSMDRLYDPHYNIKLGVWYLNWLKKKYKDNDLVLAAYNAGPGNVDKWLNDPFVSDDGKSLNYIPFEETSNYVVKVNYMYKMYKLLYSRKR